MDGSYPQMVSRPERQAAPEMGVDYRGLVYHFPFCCPRLGLVRLAEPRSIAARPRRLVGDRAMSGWRFLFRVALKTAVLFVLANLIFAALNPIEALGHVSLYNVILLGRQRLPYGENAAQSYNLSLYSIP